MISMRRLGTAAILGTWLAMILACGGGGYKSSKEQAKEINEQTRKTEEQIKEIEAANRQAQETPPPAVVESRKRKTDGPIPYEVLSNKKVAGGKRAIAILVDESATKAEVMRLVPVLRKEYEGKYSAISIFDDREAWKRHLDETYPEKKLSLHWLVDLADGSQKGRDVWVAEGRDH